MKKYNTVLLQIASDTNYKIECIKICGSHMVVLHVVQLPQLRFTQQILCCTCKSTMKHQRRSDWKSVLPY